MRCLVVDSRKMRHLAHTGRTLVFHAVVVVVLCFSWAFLQSAGSGRQAEARVPVCQPLADSSIQESGTGARC